jgi:hypothetical protein
MQRDMDTVRRILHEAEAIKGYVHYEKPEDVYHVAIMKEAGLLDCRLTENGSGVATFATVFRLTWSGHDFLDAARDDTLWNKAKEKVLKPGLSWTFSILVEYLKSEVKQRLGISES